MLIAARRGQSGCRINRRRRGDADAGGRLRLTLAPVCPQALPVGMMTRELLFPAGTSPRAFWNRLLNSAVAWSWGFNVLRLASGMILLPLVLTRLATNDLGMYYVLLSLAALVPLVDFGFSPTVGRFVGYAMGGAESIQAQGVALPGKSSSPNYRMLWDLLGTTRTIYRYLTLVLLVVLGCWGTYVVELRIHDTSSLLLTRLAWAATLATALFDLYSYWWVHYLRSMNEVVAATRIGALASAIRLLVAAVLLLAGGGLLSLPIGTLFGSILQRELARRRIRRLIEPHRQAAAGPPTNYLSVVWPNTWRTGVQLLSSYLTVNANTAICLHVFGLAANAQYGLSIQLLTFLNGMSAVWVFVKWPLIQQYQARHDVAGVRRIMRTRVWLQLLTFLAGCAALLLAGPFLLHWAGGGKQLLALPWLMALMLNTLFETQFNTWGTLLATENRLDYLWPTVATNVLSLLFSIALTHFTSLGLGSLVAGPLLAGCLFNYWYWPPYAARRLGTTLTRLLLAPPGKT